MTTTFETNEGPLEAQIERIDEGPNGIEFLVSGFAMNKALSRIRFTGAYNIESKLGRLDFGDALGDAATQTAHGFSGTASTRIPLYLFQSGEPDIHLFARSRRGKYPTNHAQ